MSKRSESVKKWRKNTKQKMIESMGGECQCCGYSKCSEALEFHHLDPSKKEFSFGKVMGHPKKWEHIKSELSKCILVCSNCHKEIHSGIRSVPDAYQQFDESLIETGVKEKSYCPICNNEKHPLRKTCSLSCAAKIRSKIDWDSIDLASMLKTQTSISIAEQIGCSDVAVYKRAKKLGLK